MDALLMTPAEAAHALRLSRSKLYQLLQDGQIRSIKIGRLRRVPTSEVQRYIGRHRSRPPAWCVITAA